MLPCYNGYSYLRSSIESVIKQNFLDFELLVSDDSSTDDSWLYLGSLHDPRIRIFRHDQRTSMAEHWEWVLSKAKGDWIIFLGQDDGLQPYFFDLSERLTAFADKKNILAIASERAFYFWPGCETTYGDVRVNFSAKSEIKILNTAKQIQKTLMGKISYFSLPQMYTTSIVSNKLISTIKKCQNGVFFLTHPQDANIAASVCLYTNNYIWSGIPLGWVGTSPKSAGMAISFNKEKKLDDLRQDYVNTINDSNLHLNKNIGSFSFGSTVLYFWGALLEVSSINMRLVNKVLSSALVIRIVFFSAYQEMKDRMKNNPEINAQYLSILSLNNILFSEIKLYESISTFCKTAKHFSTRLIRFISRKLRINNLRKKQLFTESYISNVDQSMDFASSKSMELYKSLL